jgi:hypothetical protein
VKDVRDRVVAALGEPGARELLEVLERSDQDRAALIGRLLGREDARWLAELLIDLEDDVGEIARLRLVHELRPASRGDRLRRRRAVVEPRLEDPPDGPARLAHR